MNLDYIDNEQAQGYIASRHHNNDGVYVPLAYIDMVNGKMSDAILFSQIMYWHEPAKNGHTKMRVMYDNHRWIAKNHNEWFDETRLKNSTVRNALNRLKTLELIHYKVTGYSGNKTPLIRVNWETFVNLLNNGRGKSAPIGHNVADNLLKSGQPNTENTTENTKDNYIAATKSSDGDTDASKQQCARCQYSFDANDLTEADNGALICAECNGDDTPPPTPHERLVAMEAIQKADVADLAVTAILEVGSKVSLSTGIVGKITKLRKNDADVIFDNGAEFKYKFDELYLHPTPPTMQEVDAAIYGTRDNPVKPVKPDINGLCEVVTDTVDKKQGAANMWEAVKHTWKVDDGAAWKIAKFQQFFMGTIKKTGKYKSLFDYQLSEIPSNALEVVAFGYWYRNEYDNVPLPENGEKLRSHFETFRGSGERYQKFMRQGERVIRKKLPKIIMVGINDKPVEVVEEVAEEDMIHVSPEEMQALYDNFGKGGVK